MPAVARGSAKTAAMADERASKVGGTLSGGVVLSWFRLGVFRDQRPFPFPAAGGFAPMGSGLCSWEGDGVSEYPGRGA